MKKKILIIADGYPTKKNVFIGSFVKRQVETLRKEYSEYEYKVYYNPFFNLFDKPMKKTSGLWNMLKWFLHIICFFPHLFRHYDLIHCHRFFLPVINGTTYKFFHPATPLVVTSHGFVEIEKRYKKKWVKNLCNRCDRIISVSNEMKNKFHEYFNIPQDRIIVRSCGVDFEKYDQCKPTIKKYKAGQEFHIGFVGDYSKKKRPMFFVKAIEVLKNTYKIKGTMVGGGKRISIIRDYVRDNDLPIFVNDVMPYEKVIEQYCQLDLLIFPSAREPFGLVGVEALYCHVPVIASAVGGKLDYMQDGKNGILFKNDSLDDLIEKCENLLADIDKMNEISQNARKSIEHYSSRRVAEDIHSIYTEMI